MSSRDPTSPYSQAFRLTGPKGNNAFSYERRGLDPMLMVPSIMDGALEDVEAGGEVVFEDVDDNGALQSCRGLKYFIRTQWNGIPLIIVDNHNHVFYFWHEAQRQGLFKLGATLIHVDQHKDARTPERLFEGGDLQEVFRYTNEELNVGNYIIPAQKEGLIGKVHFVIGEAALNDSTFLEDGDKILNVDLDFFAPELDYIDFLRAKAFILEHARGAKLITVATSPFFIDQERARLFLLKVFSVV